MDDFLPKPVHARDLQDAVARFVPGGCPPVGASPAAPRTRASGPVDLDVLEKLKALDADGVPGFLADLVREHASVRAVLEAAVSLPPPAAEPPSTVPSAPAPGRHLVV